MFRESGPRIVGAASAAFGLVFFGMLLPWIHLFGMAAYLLLVGLMTAFMVAALASGALVRGRLPRRLQPAALAVFPVAFLAGEFARSHVPLGGFPWGGLGYSQHANLAVLRLASYTGVWGVSLLVALVNAAIAEGIVLVKATPAGALSRLAFGAGLVLFPALLPVLSPKGAAITLGLVQRSSLASDAAGDVQSLASETALTRGAGTRLDLIVWPESSFDHDPTSEPAVASPLLAAIRTTGAAFVVGASVDAPGGKFRNESLFFLPDGSLAGRYVKIHLVPFGEYVPFRTLLAGWIRELRRVPLDGVAGTAPVVFSLPQGEFASVICYETAYPELVSAFVARGARMIVVSTNNASYLRTPASAQMVAISQLRAAEQRMWVAQAALTGISAVIAPSGKVVAQAGLFRPAVLAPTIHFATGRSVYGRYGDWLPAATLILGAMALLWSLRYPREPAL